MPPSKFAVHSREAHPCNTFYRPNTEHGTNVLQSNFITLAEFNLFTTHSPPKQNSLPPAFSPKRVNIEIIEMNGLKKVHLMKGLSAGVSE
jgi:hypothetical protein